MTRSPIELLYRETLIAEAGLLQAFSNRSRGYIHGGDQLELLAFAASLYAEVAGGRR